MCYLLVSSLQLSFGPHCRLVSICNVVSCWKIPRTCESIARLKIEHKQRPKLCNLQHFALSDGKNPRKYHSFSPRRWIKHLFTGFRSRHYFRFFGKRVNTSVFLRSARQKIGSKSATHAVIYRGLVPSRAKNIKKLCKYQRFSVQKLPKHRYLQCFVPSTFSWNCKNTVNTRFFCDQCAKML